VTAPEDPHSNTYHVDHTPWGVAEGGDVSLRESDDGHNTRRVLRWHSGVREGDRRLSVSLVHQRRAPLTGDWHDDHFDLRTLTAGQEVSIELDAEMTAKLIEHLDALRQINERLRTERGTGYRVHREDEIVVEAEMGPVIDQLRGTADPATLAQSLASGPKRSPSSASISTRSTGPSLSGSASSGGTRGSSATGSTIGSS
jgi:hypothetical protein